RPNWEIDRRRIRRRMDQDLAQATWAMTRLVKELDAPETARELDRELKRQMREELEKEREKTEQYPTTGDELQRQMQKLKERMNPILDQAMGKVKLPADM